MLTQTKIKQSQKWVKKMSKGIKNHSCWCQVMADPTRIKILLVLRKHEELCVSDIAQILKMSVSAISHQLNDLEQTGIVSSKKEGKSVCYCIRLRNKDFYNCLDSKLRIK